MKILLILFLCLNLVNAASLTKGEVAIFTYEDTPKSVGFDGEKKLPIIKHPTKNSSFVLLPIDYKTQKNEATLTVLDTHGTQKTQLHIDEGDYKKETLTVAPSKVDPPKEQLDRIYSEYNEAMQIYGSSTDTLYFDKPFIIPLDSKITSSYGNARIYNNSLQGFHGGTDFRAAVGTPIKAANDGVVVIAKDRYYAGGSVVIDHGYGIYSTYYHLSSIDMQVGQNVQRGQVIGLSGKSGRVTGPHLHFGMIVGGYAINPLDFIQKINAIF